MWCGCTYLCAEAVANSTEVGDVVLLLEVLDGVDDDGVDVLLVVWVLPVAALLEPIHDVEAGGHGRDSWSPSKRSTIRVV